MAIFGSVTGKCDTAFDNFWEILDYYYCHFSVSLKSLESSSAKGSKVILKKSSDSKIYSENVTRSDFSKSLMK